MTNEELLKFAEDNSDYHIRMNMWECEESITFGQLIRLVRLIIREESEKKHLENNDES